LVLRNVRVEGLFFYFILFYFILFLYREEYLYNIVFCVIFERTRTKQVFVFICFSASGWRAIGAKNRGENNETEFA